MSKPDDIADDIWDEAVASFYRTAAKSPDYSVTECIARAIIEQRERMPDAIDIYRLLKSQKLRARRDIAKGIEAALRWTAQPQ